MQICLRPTRRCQRFWKCHPACHWRNLIKQYCDLSKKKETDENRRRRERGRATIPEVFHFRNALCNACREIFPSSQNVFPTQASACAERVTKLTVIKRPFRTTGDTIPAGKSYAWSQFQSILTGKGCAWSRQFQSILRGKSCDWSQFQSPCRRIFYFFFFF